MHSVLNDYQRTVELYNDQITISSKEIWIIMEKYPENAIVIC